MTLLQQKQNRAKKAKGAVVLIGVLTPTFASGLPVAPVLEKNCQSFQEAFRTGWDFKSCWDTKTYLILFEIDYLVDMKQINKIEFVVFGARKTTLINKCSATHGLFGHPKKWFSLF